MGIEPTQSAWKAEILAIELHPQDAVCFMTLKYYIKEIFICQVFFANFLNFFSYIGKLPIFMRFCQIFRVDFTSFL